MMHYRHPTETRHARLFELWRQQNKADAQVEDLELRGAPEQIAIDHLKVVAMSSLRQAG